MIIEEILNQYLCYENMSNGEQLMIQQAMKEYAEQEREKAFEAAQEQNMFNKHQARYNSFKEYQEYNPLE